jgi:hypothetical protein
MAKVENKAVLSMLQRFHVSSISSFCIEQPATISHLLYRIPIPVIQTMSLKSRSTLLEQRLKKKPDYILVSFFFLMYLEASWLIVMIWRSCD